jgi:hypothetical protein
MSGAAAIALALMQAGYVPPAGDAAECLVREAPSATLSLVASEPNSADESEAVTRFHRALKRCGVGPSPAGEQPTAEFRAAVARTLASHVHGTHAGPNSNPNFSPNSFLVNRGYEQAVAMQPAYRLAHCIVAIDFNGAARLVETAPGSESERAALDAVLPDVSACVDRDKQVSLRRATLRTAIDIVFVRLLTPILRMAPTGR